MSTATVPSAAIRPAKSEFLPYYERYITLVPDGDVLSTLTTQMSETQALLHGLPASVATYRYAPEKWSVNEVIGHLTDSERIFGARALRFARNDPAPLPGFEQDDYVRNSTFDAYPLSELASELEIVRQSTIFLFRHIDEQAWTLQALTYAKDVLIVRAPGGGVGWEARRTFLGCCGHFHPQALVLFWFWQPSDEPTEGLPIQRFAPEQFTGH